MIKLINKNYFLELEKNFKSVKNYNDLKKKYLLFLINFNKLNKKYKFSENLNKTYIFNQLKKINYKKKRLFFWNSFWN